ncbi:MAG: hypothetical protein FWD89_02250 [Firmicutes bacterium]|nr:hypothetical protein [Bacillota bacterium]MCL2771112.1 hypothetical protein [Bacillota bacterium]
MSTFSEIQSLYNDAEFSKHCSRKVIVEAKTGEFFMVTLNGGNNGVLAYLYTSDHKQVGKCDINFEKNQTPINGYVDNIHIYDVVKQKGLSKLLLALAMEFSSSFHALKFDLKADPTRAGYTFDYVNERVEIAYEYGADYIAKNKERQEKLYTALGFDNITKTEGHKTWRETKVFPKGTVFTSYYEKDGVKIVDKSLVIKKPTHDMQA